MSFWSNRSADRRAPALPPALAAVAGPGCSPSCGVCRTLSGPASVRRPLRAEVTQVTESLSERPLGPAPELPVISPDLQHALARVLVSTRGDVSTAARRALAFPNLSSADLAALIVRVLEVEGEQFMPAGLRYTNRETMASLLAVPGPARRSLARALIFLYADPAVWDSRSYGHAVLQVQPSGDERLDSAAAALLVARLRGGDVRPVLSALEVAPAAVREVFSSLAMDVSDSLVEAGPSASELFHLAESLCEPLAV